MEHDDVVDAVEELRAGSAASARPAPSPSSARSRSGVSPATAKPRFWPLEMSRVPRFVVMMITVFLKSTDAALGVGQPAVLEHLQQRVEDVRVRLLDLVEQHDGERLAAHLLGELAALLVADVAGRRAEQPRHRVLLASTRSCRAAISASSSPNRNSASVLDSSVFPTPDGPAKMNEPPGRFGSFSPARVRRIACDSALIACSWPMTRLCSSSSMRSSRWRLLLGELEHRDAGRRGEHLGDQLLVDLGDDVHVAGLPLPLALRLLGEQLSSPCRAARRPSRSPARRSRTPSRGARRRSARRTRAGPAARSSGGSAAASRPRRSGRSPCPAGTGR